MNIIIKNKSNIDGLKYIPSLGKQLDDLDHLDDTFFWNVETEFSKDDQRLLLEHFNKIKNKCKCIVEIGVCRNDYPYSSTSIFLDNKLTDTIYIGIDLSDKSFLNNKIKNVYTIKSDSRDKFNLYNLMSSLEIEKIDFLFIDGGHSVNMCINDWSYTEKISDFGIIGFHGTNRHPGPMVIFEAIDETLYNKSKYMEIPGDWGVGFAIKK